MSHFSVCPGCGAVLPAQVLPPAERLNASGECLALYHELAARTLAARDPEFAHQHAVDAYAAQHAGGPSRPVTTFFALAGLYLALEKGFTGREVQQAHVRMTKGDKHWPMFAPPPPTTWPTVADAPDLRSWMQAVWSAWSGEQDRVREITERSLSPRL